MGWNGMGRDGTAWDGTGQDGMGLNGAPLIGRGDVFVARGLAELGGFAMIP